MRPDLVHTSRHGMPHQPSACITRHPPRNHHCLLHTTSASHTATINTGTYLDDRLAPILERTAVHLGDGGASQRLAVDRRKQLREGPPELLLDGFVYLVVRRRWYSVLKLRPSKRHKQQQRRPNEVGRHPSVPA